MNFNLINDSTDGAATNNDDTHKTLNKLKEQVQNNYTSKVKIPNIINNTMSYVEVLKSAKSSIFVFMNAGVEVGYNWLPPLIEPILENRTACTSPIKYDIQPRNFEVTEDAESGRGIFNSQFQFKIIPPYDDIYDFPDNNYKTPILTIQIYAISSEFYWQIGGHEYEGLEREELSVKIWLCGGQVLIIPCSKVAELSRDMTKSHINSDTIIKVRKI